MKAIIKTDEENRVALAFVERLMDGDPEKDSDEGKLLVLLAEAIQVFETKYGTLLTEQEKADLLTSTEKL